jgi:acyl-CoA synthetase (AMP-forming)/AMP-acid ligase II
LEVGTSGDACAQERGVRAHRRDRLSAHKVSEFDHPDTVPALITEATERFGDREYVVTASDRLTFRDADRRSALLARRLLAAGVGKETRVGIVLPSGIAFTLAFLAVARIGAMAMLFSSTYRPRELARVLRITDVDTLIAPRVLLERDYQATLEAAVEGLAEHPAGPIRLPSMPYLRSIWLLGGSDRAWATPIDLADTSPPMVDAELLAAVESEVAPADMLVAISTSGSSADPKIVTHTQGACVRKVHPSTGLGLPPSNPGERVLQLQPFFWTAGPQGLLGAMHSGSTIITQERFEPESALHLIERERVTIVAAWTSLLNTLMNHPAAASRDLSSLKPRPPSLLSSRGDPLNFGMTETLGAHHNPALLKYKIIDPDTGERLPDGEVGEFCVRGFGLTAGFYKREFEETFDRGGWYRTGDRGYLENGRVFFKGRYSEMLKSAGANVAPAEVEQVLTSNPDVMEAYVIGVDHADIGEEVVAILVPASGATLDKTALRAYAKENLSSYKVPARFVVLDSTSLPRLATGKPDKRAMKHQLEEHS